MLKLKVVRVLAAGSFGLACMYVTPCLAQSYPSKTVRVVVPLSPGGGTDLVVRLVTQKMSEQMGTSIIVDNRPGGGTVIGTEVVSRAVPDGYVLGAAAPELVINPTLRKLPYDTVRDFSCITQLTSGQYFLSTHPSVPVTNVQQFIALARSRPGQITYGSSGPGSANHLAGMLLQQLTGTKLIHVPYKGGGPANAALLSGETDFMFSNMASAIGHVKAGRLRAIASTGSRRSPLAPQVPTIAESGIPQFVVTGFYLLLAPAGTPASVIAKLNAESAKALEAAAIKQRLGELGQEPVGSSPEACAALITSEIAKWAPLVKASGAATQ
jgi:tripartite-type tricarboxylate transporter receptor subunit TctC